MLTIDASEFRSQLRNRDAARRRLAALLDDSSDAIKVLDLDGTIDATAKNAGELEVVTRPPRRPDTRVLLELVDLTDLFRTSELRAFRANVDKGGIVKCLPIHDAEALSRGAIDRLESFVKKELGAKGLAWVRVEADGATWLSRRVSE